MAEKRRLLAEMEKVFRKVEEGVELFEETMQKMTEANSDNQRDKFQDDLKKEIKKLQRLRDQIKGWQNSNDIKDKDKLVQYRKIIEQRMEQFKDIERENKTKPHSKQGLIAEEKLDPKVKEKSDAIECLQGYLNRLSEQSDMYECEIEKIAPSNGGRKGKKVDRDKQRRIDEVKHRLEKHKFHTQKLELVMRLINNDTIESLQINSDFKESLTHYLDNEDDEDLDVADYIYEDLNLGDLTEITQQLGNVTQIGTLEEADNLSDVNSHGSGSPSASPAPSKEGSREPDGDSVTAASLASDGIGGGGGGGRKTRHTSGSECEQPSSTQHRLGTSSSARSVPVTPLKLTQQNSSDSATTTHPSPGAIGSVVTPPVMPYSVAATARSSVTKSQSTAPVQQQSPPSASALLLGRNSPSTTAVVSAAASQLPTAATPVTSVSLEHSLHAPASSLQIGTGPHGSGVHSASLEATMAKLQISSPVLQQQQQQLSPQLKTKDERSRDEWSSVSSPTSAMPDGGSNRSTPVQQQQQLINSTPLRGTSSADDEAAAAAAVASLKSMAEHAQAAAVSIAQQQQQAQGSSTQQQPATSTAPAAASTTSSPAPQQQQQQPQPPPQQQQSSDKNALIYNMLPSGQHNTHTQQPQTAVILPALGASPLGKLPVTNEQTRILATLDAAMQHMPHASDSERQRQFMLRNQVPVPHYYPHSPLPGADSFEYFLRLQPETLFFIFYYMEGTKAQYLAAKALKNKSWRFHKKYLMWFQRHEQPETINDDYESGTYVYFDFEKWSQRKKENFTFEYKYLEDRELN